MSVAVALVTPRNGVWVAADSIATYTGGGLGPPARKIERVGPFVIAWCGTPLVAQLIAYARPRDRDLPIPDGALPGRWNQEELAHWVLGSFRPWVRSAAVAAHALHGDGDSPDHEVDDLGTTFIIATRQAAIHMEFCGQVQFPSPYVATGAGREAANAALYTLLTHDPEYVLEKNPEGAVQAAVRAAAAWREDVRGPVRVLRA